MKAMKAAFSGCGHYSGRVLKDAVRVAFRKGFENGKDTMRL